MSKKSNGSMPDLMKNFDFKPKEKIKSILVISDIAKGKPNILKSKGLSKYIVSTNMLNNPKNFINNFRGRSFDSIIINAELTSKQFKVLVDNSDAISFIH